MTRPRWPDVVIVLAIAALGAGGVWALWGDRLRDRDPAPTPREVPASTAPMT
ncbi:MAG: hypothetical protein KBG48_31595 [Kofleriaceae bacterium]|jgi:hypothetical protein|nr:hypothetical protein [Kofleriaceae bacterium]MBP9171980.1 hypothetical protein [Kofleriaceae bacterium]MBP9860510.1 hypothetical protein [Kofleriaceae bacterium]